MFIIWFLGSVQIETGSISEIPAIVKIKLDFQYKIKLGNLSARPSIFSRFLGLVSGKTMAILYFAAYYDKLAFVLAFSSVHVIPDK